MNTHCDPIAAVTASDPVCHYSALMEPEELTWNDCHGFWVAAHPAVAREVLDHPGCLVRPVREPVPARLVGAAAGRVFGNLARMQDGDTHARAKRAITLALDAVDLAVVRDTASRLMEPIASAGDLDRACFEAPEQVIASMLGVPDDALVGVALSTRDYVRCTVPAATDSDTRRGIDAAERLWDVFTGLVERSEPSGLSGSMRRAFRAEGLGLDATVANAIGLLFQAHDATAGLIGNAIVHLARHPELSGKSPETIVAHAACHDPSVHNTRRFIARDTTIAGQPVHDGDTVLVVLAAAGAVEPEHTWTFGHGRHACPGRSIALAIASETVRTLVRYNAVPARLPDPLAYHPLPNVRIPAFLPVRREATS